MIRTISISVAIFSLYCAPIYGEKTAPDAKVLPLKQDETKEYATQFWKEFDRLGVRKQIRVAFGMINEPDDPKEDIAISMHGPDFYRSVASGEVFGLLTIGAVGQFRVEFKESVPSKCYFIECWSGEGMRFDTFAECNAFVSEKIKKLFKGSAEEKEKQAEQGGTGQPATRSQSKSEGSDKPQPEAERRSR
jgi:hypothetical protein